MATTKIDVKTVRTEAGRVFYAGVGANDLAVSAVRGAVADVTKKATTRITGVQSELGGRVEAARKIDLAPKTVVGRATGLIDTVATDAKSRYAGLEAEVKGAPAKARALLNQSIGTVTSTYGTLAKRGEGVVAGAVDLVGERVAPVRRIVAKRADEVEEVLEFAAEEIADVVTDGAEEIKDAVVEPKKAPVEKPAAAKPAANPAAKTGDVATTKAPAKKAPAKKAPAKKAPAQKAPVTKAPAKSSASKPVASKAAATTSTAKASTPAEAKGETPTS